MRVDYYRCQSADPPWMEKGGGKIKRGADRHYSLLKTSEIARVIMSSPMWRPHPNGSHLWLWVINNFLLDGLRVMDELGFRYVTNMAWAKDRFGLGYYLRGQHELCLFGVMGKLAPLNRDVPSLIVAPRGKHSAKPAAAYAAMERVSRGLNFSLENPGQDGR